MSAELEDRLRTALSDHAQDPSLPSPTGLTQQAVRRASRMRRARRLQVAAGVAAVAVAVAAVPFLAAGKGAEVNPPADTPTPTPTPTETEGGTAANAVAMASATGALLASGMTILDGNREIEVRPYSPPPEGWTYAIHGLSQAGAGYWVVYGPDGEDSPAADGNVEPPPERLVFVTQETAELAAVPANLQPSGPDLAVSPGGTLVAFGAANTQGKSFRLALGDGTDVMGSKPWPIAVTPLGFGEKSVWFDTAAQPRARPYRWDFTTDTVTQLAVPETEYALTQQGDRMVLSDLASGCVSGWDVADVRHPQRKWQDCSNINVAGFSPDGSLLMTVLNGINGDPDQAQLGDPGTGRILARVTVPGLTGLGMQWTPDGRHVSMSGCCAGGDTASLLSLSVDHDPSTGEWSLTVTPFDQPSESEPPPVVLGVPQVDGG